MSENQGNNMSRSLSLCILTESTDLRAKAAQFTQAGVRAGVWPCNWVVPGTALNLDEYVHEEIKRAVRKRRRMEVLKRLQVELAKRRKI